MEEHAINSMRVYAARRAHPGITHAEAVWLDELRGAKTDTQEIMTRIAAILAQSRLGSVELYTKARKQPAGACAAA